MPMGSLLFLSSQQVRSPRLLGHLWVYGPSLFVTELRAF